MYCLIITGMPGCGKSTLADRLSKEFGLPIFAKDAFKEVLFDTIGFRSREEKVRLGTSAMNLMYHAAESLMKANEPFILDNNFENSSKAGLDRLLREYDYTAVTVRLTGDYETIYKRYIDRDLNTDRHRGHVVNDCYPEKEGAPKVSPTIKTYEQYLNDIKTRGFDSFTAGGPLIEVDVTDFSKVDYESVIDKIRNIIEK